MVNFLHRATRTLASSGLSRRPRAALQCIPPCLRPADGLFVDEWLGGRFPLAGHAIALIDGSPLGIPDAPAAWRRELHGFGWLRHIPVSGSGPAEARVHALIADWLARGPRQDEWVNDDAVVARRVMSWLAHTDLLLETSNAQFYDAVLGALMQDVHRLNRRWHLLQATSATICDRVLALVALAQAGLCLAEGGALLRDAEAELAQVLVAASSAPLWRNADALVQLLTDLEALRLLYRMRRLPVPECVVTGLARFQAVIGGLTLVDGTLARLGTSRGDPEARMALAAALRHVGVLSPGSAELPDAGAIRCVQGTTTVIVDVGAPFGAAHALEFEMSSAGALMLVHDGLGDAPEVTGRGTLVFAHDGGTEAVTSAKRRTTPTLEPTHSTTCDLSDASALSLDATHAGHALRGFAHRRRLVLTDDGARLDGIDELRPIAGGTTGTPSPFGLRFVLHPSVEVTLGEPRGPIALRLSNGQSWQFSAPGFEVAVDGALFREGIAIVPTLQLLVLADTHVGRTVTWHLRQGAVLPVAHA